MAAQEGFKHLKHREQYYNSTYFNVQICINTTLKGLKKCCLCWVEPLPFTVLRLNVK